MPSSPIARSFADLSTAFLREEHEESPVHASMLGVDGYDDRLDDLSEGAFERRASRAEQWLSAFQALDGRELTFEEQLDRDLVVSTLQGRTTLADWQMWRRQPDTYLNPGLNGVFTLFLHRLKPERELAEAAVARLRALPRNLADGQKNLRPELTPRIFVQRAIGQARAAARYARELLPAEIADPASRAAVADAGAEAAAALDGFSAYLELIREQATGDWAIGEERYSRLLKAKELLGFDTRGLRERGKQEYDRLAESLRRCAQTIAGTDDWPRVLADLNRDHPPTPEAMRQEYATWTEKARSYLRDRRLVSFPAGEACAVEPSPPFQRPVLAVASYQTPPPFSASMRGHFFVPFPPDGASEAEVAQRLENNNYASIPTTSVHEAYPGHHWHLVTMKAHPSAVRKTFRTSYFSEGWALYTEAMMREQGFFEDPRQEMSQYEATLFRAARIVVDTSLHLGEMPYDEAVRYMLERANLPEPTARAEVTRYCAWPTQAASYLTGCLEILRIREAYFRQQGADGVDQLRAFHDSIASSGALPIALAERAVLRNGARPAD